MNDDNPRGPAFREPEWGASRTPEPVRWSEPGSGWPYGPPRPWVEPPEPKSRVLRRAAFHVVFFALTIATTWFAGGPIYAAAIMSILFAHEMGHYLLCRRYGVEATWPFFIPFPSLLGTMGAVIKMRGPIPSRRALFDIAVAGPIAGLVLAIPAVLIGLHLSHVVVVAGERSGTFYLGESPLFRMLSRLVLGDMPETSDVVLHPLGFAGWAGLFVTALNLLPIGQLDGGHIVYGLLGRKSYWASVGGVAIFAAVCIYKYQSFLIFIALLLFIGLRHPAPVDDVTPIGPGRRILGIAMIIFFVLSFTLVPIRF